MKMMKRSVRSKPSSRSKKTKKSASPASKRRAPKAIFCLECEEKIRPDQNALYVEEEVGRIFCSEKCIADHFSPDIDRMEREFFRRLSERDLTAEERESYAHLRWITLEDPDEVWREKTAKGDYRYTLISAFEPGNKRIWCISICLFLRGEPSFLFLAFTTQNPSMVAQYRKGQQVEIERTPTEGERIEKVNAASKETERSMDNDSDRLAEEWTEEESLRADRHAKGAQGGDHQKYIEVTLEQPDEVWSNVQKSGKHYHFIKHISENGKNFWYVVIAREPEEAGVEKDEEIELLDSFFTEDIHLLERYRIGEQEIGSGDPRPKQRFVH